MAHYIRARQPGARIYFTVNLAQKGGALLTQDIAGLRAAVRQARQERPFHIDAWVVLPDHIHAVWTLPDGDVDYSTRWGAIKARFSAGLPDGCRRASHEKRREKGIWQRRFWEHHLRDEADYAAHVRHCWFDPVKHGLVSQPQAWPYSSIHRERDFSRSLPVGPVVPSDHAFLTEGRR
ncbi:transposase [Rhodobacteraceae bacterium KMM 6894]|nr:transposase [Rhodobacteraceae bacterium KMM 6894]